MARTLSPQAITFLRECFRSILDLDIILLLERDAARWWSADQIAQELRASASAAASSLEALAARNLLDVRIGSALAYRFAPVQASVAESLAEIAADPYSARELIAGGDNVASAARRFAEAFRLRKIDG